MILLVVLLAWLATTVASYGFIHTRLIDLHGKSLILLRIESFILAIFWPGVFALLLAEHENPFKGGWTL